MDSLPKPLLIAGIVILIASLLGPWVVFLWLCLHFLGVHADRQPIVDLANFLNAAMWVQALIAWVTFLAIAFGSVQVFSLWRQSKALYRQIELQQEQAERETYQPLISPEMVSAKRLLNSKEVQNKLACLDSQLDAADKEAAERFQEMLDATRRDFEEIAKTTSWPLLHGTNASLDHIELLLDRYNYLAKLMNEGRLQKTFATELGLDNFDRIYRRARPLIRLRARLSPGYASHFMKYCQSSESLSSNSPKSS